MSDERQTHLAHMVTDGMWKDDLVDYTSDEEAVRAAKKGVAKFVQEHEDIDKKVRDKIASLKRGVVEGSPEWDVMYDKYYEEELSRRGKK